MVRVPISKMLDSWMLLLDSSEYSLLIDAILK
jgi:hypothetical protein